MPEATLPLMLSIAAVERDTGLSKDTLRIWERRYGFPEPQRLGVSGRAYPIEQVEKLRLVKRLMDAGHRPGRIVAQPLELLRRLAEQIAPAVPARAAEPTPGLGRYLELLRAHDIDALRSALVRAQLQLGLRRFLIEVVAPLNTLIGDTWMRGHLEIFEEHLYTESLQVLLRRAIDAVPVQAGARPRVLLTTLPGEVHGIGLLMAEALFALDGCRCTSLGTQTPPWDTVLAATAQRADIVALSCSAVLSPTALGESLAELREKLPRAVELWVGGAAPVLHRRRWAGVTALDSLEGIAGETGRWRSERG